MPFPRIRPMVLSRRAAPFDHPDWLFELKHDGFRAVAYVADGELRVTDAILDGEIVRLDAQGRSIFKELLLQA